MKRSTWLLAALAVSFSAGAWAADPAPADPFLAPDSGASATGDALPKAPTDTPAPSLGTPVTTQPEAQAPLPLSSIPGKTAASPSVDPNEGKTIYEEYEDYQAKERDRQKSEKDTKMRTMFPHEGGAWQIG